MTARTFVFSQARRTALSGADGTVAVGVASSPTGTVPLFGRTNRRGDAACGFFMPTSVGRGVRPISETRTMSVYLYGAAYSYRTWVLCAVASSRLAQAPAFVEPCNLREGHPPRQSSRP